MKVKFERHTTVEVKGVIENAGAMLTLSGAANYIKTMLPTWMIYQGGHHIAIHRKPMGHRYAIITD